MQKQRKIAISLAGLILLLYALAMLFPEESWGVHFIAFLPFREQALLLGGVVLLFTFQLLQVQLPSFKRPRFSANLFIATLSLLMAWLFYSFPMVEDFYGEAYNYGLYLNQRCNELSTELYENLFRFDLRPASGRKGLLALLSVISYYSQWTYGEVFRNIGIFGGMLYSFCWLKGVNHFLKSRVWKLVMGLLGLLAPFTLIFYGHIDTYSLVYPALLAWLLAFLSYHQRATTPKLWMLFVGLLLCIKLHPLTILLFPAWLLTMLEHYFYKKRLLQQLLTLKGILLVLILPLFLAGAYLYFFYFEDYKDPRILQGVTDFDRLFLPLFSPEAPLDRYNLLGINHLIDYLNVLLFWSPLAIFLFAYFLLNSSRRELFQNRGAQLLFLSLFLFMSFLFTINPLISMPMDWDLFSIPALILFVLLVGILREVETKLAGRKIIFFALAFSSLNLAVFAVHHSRTALSYHLETVGKWVFRSYYEHAGKYLHSALGMLQDDDLYLERKAQVIADLAPYAIKGKDVKYAMLYTDNGMVYDRLKKDLLRAREAFEKADEYAPDYGINLLQLMEVNFRLKDYRAAWNYASRMLALNYPSRKEALFIALHCALEADLYDRALEHSEQILRIDTENALAKEIKERILKDQDKEKLKELFWQD
jgi:hypothetical protein